MACIGKLCRGSRRTNLAIFVVLFLVTMFLLFHNLCMFDLSDRCTKRMPSSSSIDAGLFFLRQETAKSAADSGNKASDHETKGGKFFRATLLNRSQVELTVNALVHQAQLKREAERNEKEEERWLKDEIIKSQMNTNLDDIDLDNWNLDIFYRHPLMPDEGHAHQQELKQEVTDKQYIGKDHEEAFNGLEPDDDVIEDSPETSEEPQDKQSPVKLESNQEVMKPEPNQEEEQVILRKLKQVPEFLQEGGDPATNIETGYEQYYAGTSKVVSKRKGQIEPNPVKRSVPHDDLNGINTNPDLNVDPQKIRQISDKSSNTLSKVPTKKKTKAKGKKAKKKAKKNLTFLPDSFPYYVNQYPPAHMGNYTCRDGLCSEFLGQRDELFYKYCVSRYSEKHKDKDHAPGECHFMNGTKRAAVAVVSFPGSGNTWVRGLLQQATGVCTGSIYCDASLRMGGMNGEGVRSGAVIAVKTHKAIPVTWTDEHEPNMATNDPKGKNPAYGSAILVVRNPFNALIAERSRLLSTNHAHTGEVPRGAFGTNSDWFLFIKQHLPKWQAYFKYWVVQRDSHRVLVVRYEDIKADILGTVRKMLDFLKFSYDPRELEERMSKEYGTFKRKHGEEFEHFTPEQTSTIRNAISTMVTYLKNNNHGDTFRIEEYLN